MSTEQKLRLIDALIDFKVLEDDILRPKTPNVSISIKQLLHDCTEIGDLQSREIGELLKMRHELKTICEHE